MTKQNPSVLVCTLENGEAEFLECKDVIAAQKNIDIRHVVISGLTEYRAHQELGRLWNQERPNHDLFVKIDADTILLSENAIGQVYHLMSENEATGCQVKLQDYFSGTLISGINFFSPAVTFRRARWSLFPDHSDAGHLKILKGNEVCHLEPLGLHGKYPGKFQAYHYGYRRFLKKQFKLLNLVLEKWVMDGDDARYWALKGAWDASHRFLPARLFGSEQVRRAFESNLKTHYQSFNVEDLKSRLTI